MFLNGPSRAYYSNVGGVSFPHTFSGVHLERGSYWVYATASTPIPTIATLTLEEGDADSLIPLAHLDFAKAHPMSFPVNSPFLASTSFDLPTPSILVTAQTAEVWGTGIDVSYGHHGVISGADLQGAQCQLKGGTVSAGLLGGFVYSTLSGFYVSEGSWKASIKVAHMGSRLTLSNAAVAVAFQQAPNDPWRQAKPHPWGAALPAELHPAVDAAFCAQTLAP